MAGITGHRMRHDLDGVRTYAMFVGQPRTGHSLVGALLDAHPRALIAHEADALKYVAAGFDRRRLYAVLVRAERERVDAGHLSSTGYSYAVPGQWQGRYERLDVIGDKKGGRSTMRLGDDIGLLDRLADTVGVEVRIVHVIRSPYDVIATMQRRAPNRPLPETVDLFFDLADTVAEVRKRIAPDHFHDMHLDDLIADPTAGLADLAGFLGLEAPDDWLAACGSIVFDASRRTRADVAWTPELLGRVAELSGRHAWFARYTFHDADGERAR